jgi:hypothetical protein
MTHAPRRHFTSFAQFYLPNRRMAQKKPPANAPADATPDAKSHITPTGPEWALMGYRRS